MFDKPKSKMPPTMQHGASDHFQTPDYALRPLLPYLDKDWLIWECAEGTGNLVKALKYLFYRVTGSDIINGVDFLDKTHRPPHGIPVNAIDCIITNPPYSHKNEFFNRCIEIGKPFALLQPLTTFGTFKRQKMLRKASVSVIFMGGRVNFETPSGKGSGSWFETAWFIGNFPNIPPNTLIYPDHPINRTPIIP